MNAEVRNENFITFIEDENLTEEEATKLYGDEVPDWDYEEKESITLDELKERTKEMGDEPFIMTVPLN